MKGGVEMRGGVEVRVEWSGVEWNKFKVVMDSGSRCRCNRSICSRCIVRGSSHNGISAGDVRIYY